MGGCKLACQEAANSLSLPSNHHQILATVLIFNNANLKKTFDSVHSLALWDILWSHVIPAWIGLYTRTRVLCSVVEAFLSSSLLIYECSRSVSMLSTF